MPRARLLKPGFFKNVTLARLSERHRLLYAGLWTLADRQGRLKDEPVWIRSEVFPYQPEIDVNPLLTDLQQAGFITRYTYGDKSRPPNRFYAIAIPAFLNHQTPHHREPESTIVPPTSKHARLPGPRQPEARPRLDRGEPSSSRAVTGDPVTGDPVPVAESVPDPVVDPVRSTVAQKTRHAVPDQNPADNLAVITRVAHETIAILGTLATSDLAEAVKERCARHHIPYTSTVVQKAIDSAIFQQRDRRRQS